MRNESGACLSKWIIIGTVLQLLMVISGHYNEFIAQNVFAIGGMTISLLAGAGYGRAASSRGAGAAGGAIVGGACAVLGIVVSFLLGDVPAVVLAFGTVSSAVTGAVGGLIGASLPAGTAATT